MRFIDFFAGIGGFRRGLELAGHKCVGFCEFDKFAVASYTSMHLITEEQRKYLETLPFKQRQKEILKDEYRNGEWYANDIRSVHSDNLPRADCWCFGAPCQSFSIAGKRAGLDGESGLIREIFRLLNEFVEEDRPEWLIYENVKGMLSSNKGWDYAAILSEMDGGGYDIEWQNINSACFVLQNRERIYTIGHNRRFCSRKIFPIEGTDGKNCIHQIGKQKSHRNNPNQNRVYDQNGISPCLNTMEGGGREPSIAIKIIANYPSGNEKSRISDVNGISRTLTATDYKQQLSIGLKIAPPCFCDMDKGAGLKLTDTARTLQARYNKGINNRKGEISGVAIPVLTPDRTEKRQNGRRFKENGEPMFTLTAQDRHGVGVKPLGVLRNVRTDYGKEIRKAYESGDIKISRHEFLAQEIKEDGCSNTLSTVQKDNLLVVSTGETQKQSNGIYVEMPDGFTVYAVWSEKAQYYMAIRKLTPKECFRLQGWTDDYFERAAFVNSDSQLYKQAGNGVTVDVIRAIGERIR